MNDPEIGATVSVDEDRMAQIFEEEKAKMEEEEEQLKLLATQIEGKFNTDAGQRQRKEGEWYWAERLMLGSMWRYWNRWSTENSEDPFDIKDSDYVSQDKPEFNIVKPKIKIGQAQLEMLQFGAGTDKNFDIKAKKPVAMDSLKASKAPVFYPDGQSPMMNPETQQPMTVGELAMQQSQADDEKARKMDEECWSQMSGANYGVKIRQGFSDALWYGTAIYKGPFNNNKCKKVRYQTRGSDGRTLWVSAYTEEPAPDFERVNPWLFYPDHRALSIEEAEHASVVHIYTPTQLRQLTKQDGFRVNKIAELLKQPSRSNYYQAFRARAIQYNNSKFLDNKYVCLEWHGTVGKDHLQRLGIDPPYENPYDLYKAEIWVCQGEVIYASLEMLEADNCLPFAVTCWEPDPASIFGFGAILLRDAQRVVNMTYQMLLDNAGLCAMPQVGIDKESFKPEDGKPVLMPGKVWVKTENGQGQSVKDAIEFFYPENNIEMLSRVLNMAREFGEEESIIPLMAGGLDDPQVSDGGATGMALRLQSSTTVLSSKARQWDDNITKKVVSWFYEWNMQYSQKEDIKGDYDIDVQTSTAYLNKVIGQRDIERLSLQASQDPDMKILVDRTALLRAQLVGMNIPYDSIVRSPEQVKILQQQAAEAAAKNPDPQTMKGQADMINAQAHMQSVENDKAELEFKANQGLEEARMAHEQAQANYATRNNEATARAIESQADKDIAMMELAAKDKQAADKLYVDLNLSKEDKETSDFIAGVDIHQKQQKLDIEQQKVELTKEELALARKKGSGI